MTVSFVMYIFIFCDINIEQGIIEHCDINIEQGWVV
jgi:hypothetical protein